MGEEHHLFLGVRSSFVRGFEGLRDLTCDGKRLADGYRPARNVSGEVFSFDELHHEGTGAWSCGSADRRIILDPVNGRYVGVLQRREGPSFTGEASQPMRIFREFRGQGLDRDLAIELRIPRAKHLLVAPLDDPQEIAGLASQSRGYFFGFQFWITVIGAVAASPTGTLMRNRPSGATSYCHMTPTTAAPPPRMCG